jgi:hypothetical protein
MRLVWTLVAAWLVPAFLLGAQALAAPKQTEPLLTRVKKQHCVAMYDFVAKSLKGKGTEAVSTATRNGLKDFFVTRPGKVDCTGQREIPWSDEKDREFIAAALKASKVNMTKDYGIGPAPSATRR